MVRFLDIALFLIVVVIMCLILFLIQVIKHPPLLQLLAQTGLVTGTKQGIKNIFLFILTLSLIECILVFILLIKVILNLFQKNKKKYDQII